MFCCRGRCGFICRRILNRVVPLLFLHPRDAFQKAFLFFSTNASSRRASNGSPIQSCPFTFAPSAGRLCCYFLFESHQQDDCVRCGFPPVFEAAVLHVVFLHLFACNRLCKMKPFLSSPVLPVASYVISAAYCTT